MHYNLTFNSDRFIAVLSDISVSSDNLICSNNGHHQKFQLKTIPRWTDYPQGFVPVTDTNASYSERYE